MLFRSPNFFYCFPSAVAHHLWDQVQLCPPSPRGLLHSHIPPFRQLLGSLLLLDLPQLLPPFRVSYPLWLVSRDFLLLRRGWGRCPSGCAHGIRAPLVAGTLDVISGWFPQPRHHHPGPADTARCQPLSLLYPLLLGWESVHLKDQRREHKKRCGFES